MFIKKQILLPLDVRSLNNKVFTYASLSASLGEIISKSTRHSLFGEFFIEGYPKDKELTELDISNISHSIKDLSLDETTNCLLADIEILHTPSGDLLRKELLKGKKRWSMSIRGTGTVTDSNITPREFTFDIIPFGKAFFRNTEIVRDNIEQPLI